MFQDSFKKISSFCTHTDFVATLHLSVSKFSPFMCSQPPTHLLLFPRGPPLALSPPPPCLSALRLSHTPFSLFNSLFQSKYYLTSCQQLITSQERPPLPPVCSYLSAPAGGSIDLYFSFRKTSPLHACSVHGAVD